MTLWRPTRRELITTAPAAIAASALPGRAWGTPRAETLRFLVVGDWGRRGSAYQHHVARGMQYYDRSHGPQFIVTTGDNFYNFGVPDKHSPHWRESFVDVYGPLVTKRWFPVLGNHDYAGNPVAQLGTYDNTGWDMRGTSYVVRGSEFQHPEVDLFLLDTTMWRGGNDFPQILTGARPSSATIAAQRAWLRAALDSSKADIKLVFGHHPIYSVGPHGGEPQLPDLQQLLKETGVTAYINGHDHCLYHIRDPQLDYICSGGGSEEKREYTGGRAFGCVLAGDCPEGAQPPATAPRWLRYVDRAGFALFEVSPAGVEFRFIDRDLLEVHREQIPACQRQVSRQLQAAVA